jgi:Zn finger protein HypA/HybF involved in hydrogenase expression
MMLEIISINITSSDYNPKEAGCLCEYCGDFFWLDELRQHYLDGCPACEFITLSVNDVIYVDVEA